MSLEASSNLSRRDFLVGAMSGAAAFSVAACGAASSQPIRQPSRSAHHSNRRGVEVYLPTWLDESEYQRIQDLRLQNVSRFILAFAVPAAGGKLSVPELSPALQGLLAANRRHTRVGLGIGGWGSSDADHRAILGGWKAALNQPHAFIKNAARAAKRLGVDTVDLDFEYLSAGQANDLVRLTRALRHVLPNDVRISMAVPAADNLEGYKVGKGGLRDIVDTFHVMTYDDGGPWSERASDLAPGRWVMKSADRWVERAGDAAKVSVGYPAYGYRFPGAKRHGDSFRSDGSSDTTVLYKDMPPSVVHDNPQRLTSEAVVDGDWTSLQSPAMMRATQGHIGRRHPRIGDPFLWAADGLVQAHLDALTSHH